MQRYLMLAIILCYPLNIVATEKEQIIEMLTKEMQDRGVEVGEESQKQAAKNLSGKRRFTLGSKRY